MSRTWFLFTGNDKSIEKVGLKYPIWSETTKEELLVFEDQTWRVQSNKWALNEQRVIKNVAQIGVWFKIIKLKPVL